MHNRHDLVIEPVVNHELAAFLDRGDPAGVFARYVATCVPDAHSLACRRDGRIAGTVIGGAEHDLYQAYAHWLIADSDEIALALATALAEQPTERAPGGVFHLEVRADRADIVASVLCGDPTASEPGVSHRRNAPAADHQPSPISSDAPAGIGDAIRPSLNIDLIYTAIQPIAATEEVRIERLDGPRLRGLAMAPELGPILGVLDDWTMESRLYGVLDHEALVAVAEASVCDGRYAAIQQVFTAPAHRGRGLARAVVAVVTNDLLARELIPVYVVEQKNTASVRLVEGLGYELREQWALFEIES